MSSYLSLHVELTKTSSSTLVVITQLLLKVCPLALVLCNIQGDLVKQLLTANVRLEERFNYRATTHLQQLKPPFFSS